MTMLMFSEKDPEETDTFAIDFVNRLGGSSITSTSRAITVYQGTDVSSASMLIGVSTSSGNIVSQRISYGVDGNVYRISMHVLTSGGDTLVGVAYLPVNQQ